MDIPVTCYLFVSEGDGCLGCFYVLAIMNTAAINIRVQGFVWTYGFDSLGY